MRRVVIFSIVLCSCTLGDRRIHLFILAGQSNMVRVDPDSSFTPFLRAAFPRDEIIVVKDARRGMPIERWLKDSGPRRASRAAAPGDLYDRLMTRVRTAIADKKPHSATFVWMQGEANAGLRRGNAYAMNLRQLLDQLRADLGRNDLNVVIGRLSDFGLQDRRFPHWTLVRTAQVDVADSEPRGAWVDTDDLNGPGNRLHYTPEGYTELGRRFAPKAIELIKDARPTDDSGRPTGGTAFF
jgi:hypothetical protein